jgi:hypothetical protein
MGTTRFCTTAAICLRNTMLRATCSNARRKEQAQAMIRLCGSKAARWPTVLGAIFTPTNAARSWR